MKYTKGCETRSLSKGMNMESSLFKLAIPVIKFLTFLNLSFFVSKNWAQLNPLYVIIMIKIQSI